MSKAPISWHTILILDNIADTKALYTKVVEHERELVHAARMETSSFLMAEDLQAALKQFNPNTGEKSSYRTYPSRSAYLLITNNNDSGNEELRVAEVSVKPLIDLESKTAFTSEQVVF